MRYKFNEIYVTDFCKYVPVRSAEIRKIVCEIISKFGCLPM